MTSAEASSFKPARGSFSQPRRVTIGYDELPLPVLALSTAPARRGLTARSTHTGRPDYTRRSLASPATGERRLPRTSGNAPLREQNDPRLLGANTATVSGRHPAAPEHGAHMHLRHAPFD